MVEVLVGEWQAAQAAQQWQDEPVAEVAGPSAAVDAATQQRANALVAQMLG